MKNKSLKTLSAFLAMLIALTPICSASLSVVMSTDKGTYCPVEPITFESTVRLTECEQLKDVTLRIGEDVTCSLPEHYGYYPSYGNCDLEVLMTETNPDNCYTFGGSNTIEYTATWNLPRQFSEGTYQTEITIQDYQDLTASADDEFDVSCPTTTTTSTTTTTTAQTTSTTSITSSTTTTTSHATTTTRRRRDGGGDNDYPPKPPKIIASCNDGIKNQAETDIDCGGLCPPCGDGKRCLKDSDCESGYCINGRCATPSCDDGIKNNEETDIDCGGGTCDKCLEGQQCIVDEDCETDYCEDGICKVRELCLAVEANCSDGRKNQDESDIDCGGICDKCADDMRCSIDSDCLSGYCLEHRCTTPSCFDSIKNQNETDVDCGGPCRTCPQTGLIGYISAFSGDIGNILLILVILLLLALLLLYLTRKRKYVASADFLESVTDEEELEKFIKKTRPQIVSSTSRKEKRLKSYIDEGKVDIIWIKDWDMVNQLVLKGIDDNNAESITLAKQLSAGLFIKSPEAKKIAEEEGVKVYDSI